MLCGLICPVYGISKNIPCYYIEIIIYYLTYTCATLLLHIPRHPTVGAATSVYCALCPEVASQSGAHFADCAVDTVFLHPKALDAELAEALWKASEKIVAK